MISKEMAFDFRDGVFLVVHTTRDPSNEDWDAYLTELERTGPENRANLVYSRGGGPSPVQRSQVAQVWKHVGRAPPVAVVVPSMPKRAVITALSFLAPNPIRAFDPHNREEAYDFLKLSPEQREAVSARLWHLCQELRIPLATSGSRPPSAL